MGMMEIAKFCGSGPKVKTILLKKLKLDYRGNHKFCYKIPIVKSLQPFSLSHKNKTKQKKETPKKNYFIKRRLIRVYIPKICKIINTALLGCSWSPK